MINTVEKIYEINDDGTLTNNFCNVYKVVYENGITRQVPLDEANTDYQAILEWQKIDGNEIIDNGGGE